MERGDLGGQGVDRLRVVRRYLEQLDLDRQRVRRRYEQLVRRELDGHQLDRAQLEALRKVVRFGPEVGVHTVGWWRSPARLRSLLTMSASPDDLGAFVALDVQGAELGTLAPPGLLPVWSPRPGRALLFDRARHARPEVVIVPEPDEVTVAERADAADTHVHLRLA